MKKTYIWASGEVLAQHDGDYTAEKYFYFHDRLGSVREIIDSFDNVVNHYTYGPFGQTVEQDDSTSLNNNFMFTGQYYDYEISQYYLRARQYDPQLMRFSTRDRVEGKKSEPLTLHRYLYCLNAPVNRVDLNGRSAWSIAGALVCGDAVYSASIYTIATGLAN